MKDIIITLVARYYISMMWLGLMIYNIAFVEKYEVAFFEFLCAVYTFFISLQRDRIEIKDELLKQQHEIIEAQRRLISAQRENRYPAFIASTDALHNN